MKISIGDTASAETTPTALPFSPRFDFTDLQVIIGEYQSPAERDGQLADTFGSMQWLWSEDDWIRFDLQSRNLTSATFQVPSRSAGIEVRPSAPPGKGAPSGLCVDTTGDFSLPQTTVLLCDRDATELLCFQSDEALETPVEERLGIAPDVDLLVRRGAVIGWSLHDPARWLANGFSVASSTAPAPVTRLRLAECLALVTEPLVDEVMEQEADALRTLYETERALRDQHEDRTRADILHQVISRLVEDYGS